MRKEFLMILFALLVVVSCNKNSSTTSEEKNQEQYETVYEFDDEVKKEMLGAPPPPTPAKEVTTNQDAVPPPPPPNTPIAVEMESTVPPPPPPSKKKEVVNLIYDASPLDYNTEDYAPLVENEFKQVSQNPLSTFSIDVDRASYSNVRRFIQRGSLPPKDAVRIEEMVNYFDYNYENPSGKHPYDIQMSLTESPWNKDFQLAHIALQAKRIDTEDLPPSNLVFLIDVSGSMMHSDKLPLLKSGFNLLVDNLREKDQVSIVVYAGAAGLVLEPTSGDQKEKIRNAINDLRAGGSTAGGAGIELAYKTAMENFKEEGNNRVILATDGDFNIGVSSDGALQRLIEKKRESGVFLSVLGFGTGNYKDNKMEILANKGNGNYSYIDNLSEAKKVFVSEFGGTLFTVAKDVKLQVEFNPQNVEAYRLIGYENRMLNKEDFNDDTKDAGEMGAGHSVTAIYEIIPKGVKNSFVKPVDELKYQESKSLERNSKDVFTVKTRYKLPEGSRSILFDKVLVKNELKPISKQKEAVKFSIAVAEFGLLLRDSKFKGDADYSHVIDLVRETKGEDEEGRRSELLQLAKNARTMSRTEAKQ